MGLPGSGKTWLGKRLSKHFGVPLWDADVIRKIYNDWDFSNEGRYRQANRMRKLAELDNISISCFICPLPSLMKVFSPDRIIWMNTLQKGRYEDTNNIFIEPTNYDICIKTWLNKKTLHDLITQLSNHCNELIE